MPRLPSPALPRLAACDLLRPAFADDGRTAVHAWAAHVAAGRIGHASPPAAELRGRLTRSESLICVRSLGLW